MLQHSSQELQPFTGARLAHCLRTLWYPEDVSGFTDHQLQAIEPEPDSVCLLFADGRSVEFYPVTETFSFRYAFNTHTDSRQRIDVSENTFWESRIGATLTNIAFLYSPHREEPYAIRFDLSNGRNFELEYSAEEDELVLIAV